MHHGFHRAARPHMVLSTAQATRRQRGKGGQRVLFWHLANHTYLHGKLGNLAFNSENCHLGKKIRIFLLIKRVNGYWVGSQQSLPLARRELFRSEHFPFLLLLPYLAHSMRKQQINLMDKTEKDWWVGHWGNSTQYLFITVLFVLKANA